MSTTAETTPTPFEWPSGPASVQVSGDWDGWKEKEDLDKQVDGSFSKKISLPSNSKHQYKYIVDGQWTTNTSSPVDNTDGNQNNVVEVGPPLTTTESATAKAGEIGAGIAAGIGGIAAAASAAAYHLVDQVNGEGTEKVEDKKEDKEISSEEKKAEPAAGLKTAADEDIRNNVPTSVTNATHGAMPVIASAVATVTGADIMRGNPESLPVLQKEVNDTEAQAVKGDNAALRSRLEPQGGAISDPAAATTENAKAAATVANNATTGQGAPIVPVTNNGFAANVTGQTGDLTTAADADKVGGEKAGAVAAASGGALGAVVAGGAAATAAKPNGASSSAQQSKDINTSPQAGSPMAAKTSDLNKSSASVPGEAIGAKTAATPTDKPALQSTPIAAAVAGSTNDKKMPSVGPSDSKAQADKANAPAAATSAPLASGKETTTPAAAPVTAAPPPKAKVASSTPIKKPVPSAAAGDSAIDKSSKTARATNASTASTVKSSGSATNNSKPVNVSPATAKTSTVASSPATSAPATPERKKKTGLFGKIKQALTPQGSPDK